ncbi:MAG TPA: hypothetical protein VNM45_18020 [Bacillus sp. (in: firmicutes)]|nr:hypothetical protein [Bacillus sp. (in: firmicutes)]
MSKGAIMLIWAIVTCTVIGIFIFLNYQSREQVSVNSILTEQHAVVVNEDGK